MRYHRHSVMLATAICATAATMGIPAAHADSAAPFDIRPVRSRALLPTQAPGKKETSRNGADAHTCGPPYVTGDPDLGPKVLPRTGYLGAILRGYVPLGGLEPQHFLSRYWDYAVNNYRFPPDDGFGRSGNYPNGRLLLKTTFLQIGMKLDRFGGYSGAFLSPLGDLFIRRALPPRNLNTNPQDPTHPCNYHAFKVLKTFRVEIGPAAPAFQQPGGGTQYHVVSKYIPEAPQADREVPVSWLLANGYLEEIEPPTQPVPVPDPAGVTSGTTSGITLARSDAGSGSAGTEVGTGRADTAVQARRLRFHREPGSRHRPMASRR
ncbi:TNT domain-containing protein [Nonomuraea rhodomycinica]|uniref:TNT domain-containing protein n=1 Tax=Nonomuraea rhodomycinica TaxID=1712872 RepID=A0A7Y6IUR8_9ACTN|nr:TNT domain-containing protein [Nonomuraea rhodomycinica]NUW44458.1 TNT domain-containing protein [Nonomuraea rhodomycinica]